MAEAVDVRIQYAIVTYRDNMWRIRVWVPVAELSQFYILTLSLLNIYLMKAQAAALKHL